MSPGEGGCCGDTGAGAGCRAPLGLQEGDLTMHNSARAQLDTLDTRAGYQPSRSLKFHNHREATTRFLLVGPFRDSATSNFAMVRLQLQWTAGHVQTSTLKQGNLSSSG